MGRPISVWILGDQLRPDHPALRAARDESGPDGVRVVLVESRAGLRRLPFHRKRQVLHLSAGRHFAAELEGLGYLVDRVRSEDSRRGLADHVARHRPSRLVTMAAADHAPRRWQLGTMGDDLGLPVEVLPNSMFLVGEFDPIPDPRPGVRYVMEDFYRSMRRRLGVLIEPDGRPTGGRWNYDAENRRRLPRGHRPPPPLRFEPDAITREVMAEVEAGAFGVGSASGFDLPTTRLDAEAAFDDFLARRLPEFGRFQDAMSRSSGVLHHSTLSAPLNLGLLEPRAMARAVEAEFRSGRAPLNSAEGFIRQVIGWREFIYWQYHRQMPGLRRANGRSATRPLPRLFWDGRTEMSCLASVIGRLIGSGFAHHIERLMVLCNFAMLAGVDPGALADWFLAFYADSHDWVVLPNVIGMGLNADGGLTATKPYIASGAYIRRMGDFCETCPHDPRRRSGPGACPFNTLYWNFLAEHEAEVRADPRIGPAALHLDRIGRDELDQIRDEARRFLDRLDSDPPPARWAVEEPSEDGRPFALVAG